MQLQLSEVFTHHLIISRYKLGSRRCLCEVFEVVSLWNLAGFMRLDVGIYITILCPTLCHP